AVLDQRHADQPSDLVRKELLALAIGEPRIRQDVVDRGHLATAARVNDGLAELRQRAATGEARQTVGIRSTDDELVTVDIRVIDAVRAEMFSDAADADVLNFGWVG